MLFITMQQDLITVTSHYHLIIDNRTDSDICSVSYPIPCFSSCYKFLISTLEKRTLQGDVFTKVQGAVLYNNGTINSFDKMAPNMVRKLLPLKTNKLKQTSTSERVGEETFRDANRFNSCTLSRFQRLCKGRQCAALLLIMDILDSGCGSIEHKDSESCLNFSLRTNKKTNPNQLIVLKSLSFFSFIASKKVKKIELVCYLENLNHN